MNRFCKYFSSWNASIKRCTAGITKSNAAKTSATKTSLISQISEISQMVSHRNRWPHSVANLIPPNIRQLISWQKASVGAHHYDSRWMSIEVEKAALTCSTCALHGQNSRCSQVLSVVIIIGLCWAASATDAAVTATVAAAMRCGMHDCHVIAMQWTLSAGATARRWCALQQSSYAEPLFKHCAPVPLIERTMGCYGRGGPPTWVWRSHSWKASDTTIPSTVRRWWIRLTN